MSISKILKKKNKEKITMITAYDAPSARIAYDAKIDMILVGDSIANTIYGYKDTLKIELEDMIKHAQSVKRGATDAFVVGDLPFLSYQVSTEQAIENAGKMLKYSGVNAIKLEGGSFVCDKVFKIVNSGIPVMGHIGFTPQSYNQIGIRSRGKNDIEAERLIEDAKKLEDAGAFSIVLEMVTEDVAKKITESISIPTIGIGSGKYCDGQVLVWHDLLGMNPDFSPKFSKKYLDGYGIIKEAIKNYIKDVKSEKFPSEENTFKRKLV
ncbi:3-methyl-2-oxobutanoate hydroxymethyltransferase [Tepiditoga spiralis]|uniref:3-methyl-2-oxobutanoate hydroxymethyltransferase n=1 Tax=Tepiditoga spiralis TaxID=2108365 RepID=UPI001688CA08